MSLNLYRLQQIDTQLDHTAQRLQEILLQLNDLSTLQSAEMQAKQATEYLQKQRKALHQAEIHCQDQKIKIEQTEATLYGGKVRNPKELQDLQHESAALKRYLVTLEDRQLEAMLAVEDAEAAAKTADQELSQVRARLEEQHAQLRGERSQLEQSLERLKVERQAAEAIISSQDLAVYLQLRKTRSGMAITKIMDRSCGACGASLTPALMQAASSSNQLARCPSCNRILYPG